MFLPAPPTFNPRSAAQRGEAKRNAARRGAANIVTKHRFQTYLRDTAADVADGCSPAFLSVFN